MSDILTIVTKELKEFWKARGTLRARLLGFLPLLIIFGVYFPLQQREMWTEAPFVPGLYFMWLPFVLAGGTTADSFAGERERHTLETLLATRLSDRDIFLGKVVAIVIHSLSVTWVAAAVALITLNVTAAGRPFYMFAAPALALIIVGGLLVSLLMTAIGVLASLRAASVRAAAQWFSIMTLLLFIGGPLLLQALPASIQFAIARVLETANWTTLGIAAALAVLALDVSLLVVGIARFQRTRLILEE